MDKTFSKTFLEIGAKLCAVGASFASLVHNSVANFERVNMNIQFRTIDELRELVAVSGEIDGSNFGWEWESWSENPFQRRQTLLAELLENLPEGIAESAPILTDVRTRDAFLRTFYELFNDGKTEQVSDLLEGLLEFAQGSKGEVRGMALTCWAGCLWLLGNSDGIAVVSELEEVSEISLWQLLDMAMRHNVPSSVWGSSLKAVSLEACLTGAV